MHRLVASMCDDVVELVDVDLHESLVSPDQLSSAEYRRALAPLAHDHLRHQDLEYVVTVREDEAGREFVLLDTTQDSAAAQKERRLGRDPKRDAWRHTPAVPVSVTKPVVIDVTAVDRPGYKTVASLIHG